MCVNFRVFVMLFFKKNSPLDNVVYSSSLTILMVALQNGLFQKILRDVAKGEKKLLWAHTKKRIVVSKNKINCRHWIMYNINYHRITETMFF